MAQVGEEYRAAISDIKVQPGVEAEFFSSVTGKRAAASDLGPDYWVSNMLNEVKFDQSLRQLCLETSSAKKTQKRTLQSGIDDIIELGPHSALAGPIEQIIKADEKLNAASITYYSALTRNKNAVDTVLKLLCSLFTNGYPINLSNINRPTSAESLSVLVDLPSYSWNHSNTYWHESRKSKAYRNRPFPRTDLLGALERTSSPLEPRWGNHIRLSEIPWVRDHVIQSNIVYPAAGYIVMAIEAAFQRAMQRSVPTITGYKLREVVIGSALVIPEHPGEVEVSVSLKASSDSMSSPSDLWDEFIVSSVSGDDRWTEHCRGLISVQTPSKVVNVIDGEAQKLADRNHLIAMIHEYDQKCQKDIVVEQFYQTISKLGLEYGETFACMTEARSGPNACIGRIKIPDTAAVMPQRYQFPFVIHPATLDSLFHTMFVALSAEDMKDPAVPVAVEDMFISSSITCTPGDELISYTSTEKKYNRSISASLTVLGADQGDASEPVISIRGINCATLGATESQDASEKQCRAYNFKWKPDIDMLSPEGLSSLLPSTSTVDNMNIRHKFEVAAFYLLKSVVDKMKNKTSLITTGYQQRLWSFLSSVVETTIKQNMGSLSEQWISVGEAEQIVLLNEIKSHGPEGRTLCQIGERLPSILRGKFNIIISVLPRVSHDTLKMRCDL
jgi:acyl transferase domain-containing protein